MLYNTICCFATRQILTSSGPRQIPSSWHNVVTCCCVTPVITDSLMEKMLHNMSVSTKIGVISWWLMTRHVDMICSCRLSTNDNKKHQAWLFTAFLTVICCLCHVVSWPPKKTDILYVLTCCRIIGCAITVKLQSSGQNGVTPPVLSIDSAVDFCVWYFVACDNCLRNSHLVDCNVQLIAVGIFLLCSYLSLPLLIRIEANSM